MDTSTDYEVPGFFTRSTTKSMTEAKQTPVILVCIYNKNNTLISHELLYNVFSAYGKILRILIFEKVKVWKAFVEFATVDEAREAKQHLNDFLLFSDGTRMNIYLSNLDTIKFQNNNSGGIDYTQIQENDLQEFKGNFNLPEAPPTIHPQTEAPNAYNPQYSNGFNNYEQFERSTGVNTISQPGSSQLKWNANDSEDADEEFLRFLNDQNRDRERETNHTSTYENDSKGELEDDQLIHKFLADAFPGSRTTQNLPYDKQPKQQSLKIQSQPFGDPAQPSFQNPQANSNSFWPQNISNSNTGLAPPGLSYFNQNEHMFHSDNQPKLMRMPNSFGHIPLKHHSPHNTPPISRNSTFTDLPQTNNMNPNSLGNMPRHNTFNDLPKPGLLPKPQLSHFGSVSHLPVVNKSLNPSGFGNMGIMHQGGGHNLPHFNKPMLNPRFSSQPELPLTSEINKMRISEMNTQSLRDLIERDILLRLMMNKIQNPEGMDMMQQNIDLMDDLNDIKKFSPALSNTLAGEIDYNDLSQMNKGTLDQIYQDLSNILGKGAENKECAVLYVKGLEHKDIRVQMLYNIFSNFGNIKKIIFIRRQAAALIEYETVEYATRAKDYLNNIVFMGRPLRIYYSFHPIINLKNKKNGKDNDEEIFLGGPKTYRFKKTKNISMNPPSSTLHISNLLKELCSEDIMRNYFSPYGRIEAIQFKFMDNNRNMCLIRMASMEESLNAMAYLHDTDLGGRPIQISFTKSKI